MSKAISALGLTIAILLTSLAQAQQFTPQQFQADAVADGKKDCTAGLQTAFEAAAKAGGEVYLSPGDWRGNVAISNVEGMTIRGDSRNRTILRGTKPNTPALRIEGFWYSTIRDLAFGVEQGLKDCGVLEIDKGKERGVQANTYQNIAVGGQGINDGRRSRFAMTMCRVGTNSAQGSEQLFLNCHFSGASQACYYQQGYNALNNTFVGGNFQSYDRCGIELVFGSLQIFSVGFQSTAGYGQIDSGGWDIKADSGGVGDALVISGCRSESLRFFKGCGSQPASLIGCLQAQNGDYDPKRPFDVVDMPLGTIVNCVWNHGTIKHELDASNPGKQVSEDYTCTPADRWVFVDPKKDARVTLCNASDVPHGFTITVVRAGGTSKGEVCVFAMYLDNLPIHDCRITSSAQFMALGGGTSPRRWYRIR